MELPLAGTDKTVLVDPDVYEYCKDKKVRLSNTGYPRFWDTESKKRYSLHRFVMGDIPPGYNVDHINRNPLDCRRANLRLCTQAENARNVSKQDRPTSSRYKGVTWNRAAKKFQAQLQTDKRMHYLGCFSSEREAALAYDRAAREHFGEFACCNFPEGSEVVRYVPHYEGPVYIYNYCTFNITQ